MDVNRDNPHTKFYRLPSENASAEKHSNKYVGVCVCVCRKMTPDMAVFLFGFLLNQLKKGTLKQTHAHTHTHSSKVISSGSVASWNMLLKEGDIVSSTVLLSRIMSITQNHKTNSWI